AQVGREEVASVDFVGNVAFADAELHRAILTEATSCPLILSVTTCALGFDWGRSLFYYSPRTVEVDVLRLTELYRAHGYRAVQVDTLITRSDGRVSVGFLIDEGEPLVVGSLALEGDSVDASLGLGRNLPLRRGDPLSFLLMQETLDTLTARLKDSGYGRAEVFKGFRRLAESDSADVYYTVYLGPRTRIGPITISQRRFEDGEEVPGVLDDQVILGRLPFAEGQIYRQRQIREAQRSLYQLDIVTRARVEEDTVSTLPDSLIPVRIEILEGDLHRVRAGGGLNSAECANVEGRWASRNFYGGGRTIQVRGGVSNLLASTLQPTPLCDQAGTGEFGRLNWSVGIDFNQPTFFSPATRFFAGVFGERQSLRNIFVRDAFGLDFGLSRSVGGNAFVNLRLRPQLNRLDAAEVILCATFSACEPEDINVLQGANWLSPVALSFTQDRSDRLFSPRSGFRALLDLEAASGITGSDYSYVRAVADGSLYQSLDQSTVLALRLRAGRIEAGAFEALRTLGGQPLEIVPPQKRFYAGGANSVRGFAQSTLGPRSLSVGVGQLLRRPAPGHAPACQPTEIRTLTCDGSPLVEQNPFTVRPIGGLATFEGSVELRFDLSDGVLGGAAFVDVGQVWPTGFDFRDLELTPGIGLRYNTLFGPVRLDLAYSFRDQEPLRVVTSQIRPYLQGQDDEGDRINIAPPNTHSSCPCAPEPIDWVISDDLALLSPRVLFGDDPGFSLRRFQIHFSIGQAF
ncbi:MAG: BamA/TamA family outer membrane protein, partial [Gemmatimonadota bacterium]|nr:BamA/TamA family outer membrane protein [Gemmatimonadota bacterium]